MLIENTNCNAAAKKKAIKDAISFASDLVSHKEKKLKFCNFETIIRRGGQKEDAIKTDF